jgi:hypothetical protein
MNTTSIMTKTNPFVVLLIVIIAQQVTTSLAFSAFTKTSRINPRLHFDLLSSAAERSMTTAMALTIHTTLPKKVWSHRGCNPLRYSEEMIDTEDYSLPHNCVDLNDDDENFDTIHTISDDNDDDDEFFVDPIEEAFDSMKHPMEFMLMPQWRQWKFGM